MQSRLELLLLLLRRPHAGALINNAGCAEKGGRGGWLKAAHTAPVIDCFVSERVFNLWEVRPGRTPSVLRRWGGVEPLPAVCLPPLLPHRLGVPICQARDVLGV